jgi:hypothetical protein
MLARARAAGQLRPDVTETDVALIQFMLTALADITLQADRDVWRRYLGILIDGLRAPEPAGLPVPPLSRDALDEVVRALPRGR